MKYNYDLSIIVPGIRNEHWDTLYEHAKVACKKYSFEFIFSGPYPLTHALQKEKNVKYIKTFGSPTRALHMATLISEGKYFTWLSDDAHLYPDSIDMALELLIKNNAEKDIVCVRYTEGEHHCGQEFPLDYWTAGYHADLHAPGVDKKWKIPCVMMLALERYNYLGGIDTRFEHINMNVHDLAFRAQKDGSKVHLSPLQVMNCDWDSKANPSNSPVQAAFSENDRPLFWDAWKDDKREIRIDLENWRESPTVWHRRKY